MNKLVYLAGPITGTSYKDCTSWRDYVKDKLSSLGISGLCPMRNKEYLENETKIDNNYKQSLSSQKGITTRDRWDCSRSHAVLFNLLGAKIVSIGTMIEMGWASAAGNPIVLVMEKEGNIHEHGIVRELAGFRVETLDEAINVIASLFNY